MLRITKQSLAQVTGGRILDPVKVGVSEGLVHDSREVRGGELFVALQGEKQNGVQFVKGAFERGAALFIVAENSVAELGTDLHPYVVAVADPLKAYWDLGRWWAQQCKVPTLAVTGSVGKTTVKELLSCILMTTGRGHYSVASYNNHTGVPYTLARLDPEHEWAVVEMGMNAPGELRQLVSLANPKVALITCIAAAHLGGFAAIEDIARAKLEIAEGVAKGGCLVLNADDDLLLSEFGKSAFTERVDYFGRDSKATVRILEVKSNGLEGIVTTLQVGASTFEVVLPLPGEHNAINLAAAFAGALQLVPKLDIKAACRALKRFVAPVMRMEVITTRSGPRIVNDTYNANPRSMSAFTSIAKDLLSDGQRVAFVVGDMLELGEQSAALHTELGQNIAELNLSKVIYVGEFGEAFKEGFGNDNSLEIVDRESVAELLIPLKPDVVMLKASRGIGLEKVSYQLVEAFGGESHTEQELAVN